MHAWEGITMMSRFISMHPVTMKALAGPELGGLLP